MKSINGIILIGYTKEKSLSDMLSGDSRDDEFVKLSTYEKLEAENGEIATENLKLKSVVEGLQNHNYLLRKENKQLIEENKELAKSLESVSVELAQMKSEKSSNF